MQGKVTFCKDLVVQGESLAATRPSQLYTNDEKFEEFENLASSEPEKEVTNSGTAATGEPNTQSGDESKEYLYAVVDKAKKKRKPPQVKYISFWPRRINMPFSCLYVAHVQRIRNNSTTRFYTPSFSDIVMVLQNSVCKIEILGISYA